METVKTLPFRWDRQANAGSLIVDDDASTPPAKTLEVGNLDGTVDLTAARKVRQIEILGIRRQLPNLEADQGDDIQSAEIPCALGAGEESQTLTAQFNDGPSVNETKVIDPATGATVATWRHGDDGRLVEVEIPRFGLAESESCK